MTVKRMQQRRGTAAEWTTADPTLLAGEIGYETDTGKQKIGDGATVWNSLAYSGGGTPDNGSVTVTKISPSTLVTAAETIAANNNDITIPTSAAVQAAITAATPTDVMEYKGVWNASTNSPTLADGTGNAGDLYRVGTAGTRNLGSGSTVFDVGDYAIYNGSTWEKSDTTDAVSSVAGRTGAITLAESDITGLTADLAAKSPLLTTVTVLTANTAPAKFQSTSYDATAGALAVPLPALSGLTAGDWYAVQRYQLDTSTNAITFTASGSDTFDSGSTSFSPSLPGELRYLQVVTVASVKKWKIAYGNTPLGSTDRRYGTQNRGNVAIWFGDSIGTAQDMIVGSANLVDHTIRSESTFTWASILSGQRLRYFRNASKGGDNAATAMARWSADVAPYDFSVLVWALGTNDSFLQTTVAAYAALVKEAHAKTRAKGADFVICTVPPNDNLSNNPTNRKSLIVQYNQFLRDYAAKWGLILIDFFDLLSDTSGNYASGYSTDKTHPIAAGYRAMGALVADTLALYLPPFSAPLPRTTTDANLITEPLFLGGLNGSFVPTGWSMPSGVLRTGVTASLVTSDTDIKGNWYKMVVANTFSGPQTIFQTISSGITAGRKYRFLGRIKMLNPVGITITARIAYDANFDYTGDGTNTHEFRAMSGLGGAIASGVFWFDSVAPVSAATAQINLQIVGNGGTGEVHLAQIGVYDITDVQAAL